MLHTMTAGSVEEIGQSKSLSKVLVQINHGGTDVYLFGSVDGTNFVEIEAYTADTVKEVTAFPHMSVSATSGDHDSATSMGSTTASILEISGY